MEGDDRERKNLKRKCPCSMYQDRNFRRNVRRRLSINDISDVTTDINNRNYEELLALDEQNVSSGSNSSILKCLTVSVHCSSNALQDEEICVICLEEYKEDTIGTLKLCDHKFHIKCIQKWLTIKSLCPICKASALQ